MGHYLHYFPANCGRKNPISDLVGYLLQPDSLQASDVAQLLAKVATFRELSMTSNFGCFSSLRVALRPV